MKKSYLAHWGLLALGVAFVGCGGRRIDSGLDQNRTGASLAKPETVQLCVAVLEYAEATLDAEADCRATGVGSALTAYTLGTATTDEQLQTNCQSAEEACLSEAQTQEAPTQSDYESNCDFVIDDAYPDCQSTVGEIETCIADSIDDQVTQIHEAPACGSLTVQYIEEQTQTETDEGSEFPASCETVQQNCSALFQFAGYL